MPMIIKGGKRYCSSGSIAKDMIYNNKISELKATNVQDAIDEINSNLTSDIPFKFGKNEDGKYGYIITDEDGADTVIPFSDSDQFRLPIITALPPSFGLTEASTWADIIQAINKVYPDKYDILANFTKSNWKLSKTNNGTVHSGSITFNYRQGSGLSLGSSINVSGDYYATLTSKTFDITGYKYIHASYTSSDVSSSKGNYFRIKTTNGYKDIKNGKPVDISSLTGDAQIQFKICPGYSGSTILKPKYNVTQLYLTQE